MGRGVAGYSFEELVAAKSGVLSVRLRVTTLIFRWLCLGVTHPRPLFGTGRFGSYVLFGNERFEWGYFPS